MKIVLASASPRRKELMEMLGVQDLVIIPAKGEEKASEGLAPDELVKVLSLQKAEEIAAGCSEDDVVIGADTIVWANNSVYGKPRDRQHAMQMLQSLQQFSDLRYRIHIC